MAEVYSRYTEELNEQYGYLATWLPNVRLNLGDVGILRRDRFDFVTTLANLGISFVTRDIGDAADYEYLSQNGATLDFETSANAAAVGTALGASQGKASVTFKRANAVMFLAKGCKATFIDQQDALGREILARHQKGEWPKNQVVVTELVMADSATVIVSATADAKVEFSAESKLAPRGMSLADASAGLQISRSSGVATQILATRQLTPLFRASGLRWRVLSGTHFEHRSMRSGGAERQGAAAPTFSDLSYDDLE